jgi:hypothetical protein
LRRYFDDRLTTIVDSSTMTAVAKEVLSRSGFDDPVPAFTNRAVHDYCREAWPHPDHAPGTYRQAAEALRRSPLFGGKL